MTAVKKWMLVFVMVAILGVILVASLAMSVVQIGSGTRYYEAYGTATAAESSYEQMMDAVLTKEEFVEELVETVRATAEDVGFDPATAIALLEDRRNSGAVSDAIRYQDVSKLDWAFCEIVVGPIESEDGKHYEMVVKPLAAISSCSMPETIIVSGYTEHYPGLENLNVEDKILFPFGSWGLDQPTIINGEPAWKIYAYEMIGE